MRYSQTITKISPAIVKALNELENISRDKEGQVGNLKFKYATLASMLDEIKPVLEKHGLCVLQFLGDDNESARVETVFLHDSGEWISGYTGARLPYSPDPQTYGVNITSVRRFALAAACMIAQADDTTQTPPAASNTLKQPENGELVYPFGAERGTVLSDCTDATLQWFIDNRFPTDPSDRFYEKNMQLYREIERIMRERHGDHALSPV